jgi:parvulin-like peptidyl-prolyl isomerase
MSQYLTERIPTVAEQVRLYLVNLSSPEEASEVKERLDAGEDFLTVARELYSGEASEAAGGASRDPDVGWFPREALNPIIARAAFNQLEVGEHSEPLVVSQMSAVIIKVVEKATARQVEDQILEELKAGAFERWLQQEIPYHRVVIRGLNNGYDYETEAWIQWQLQKMR